LASLINRENAVRGKFGMATLGLNIFKIGAEREAAALSCDCPAHGGSARTAWFDSGSQSGNLCLAKAAGWTEGRSGRGAWICPQCAERTLQNKMGDEGAPRNVLATLP
jgi:hypothetical protein